MATVNWNLLCEYQIEPGPVTKPWILVLDGPKESTYLQIKAAGKWTPAGGLLGQCGPDGLLGAPFQTDKLVVSDCPVGALIGKFGGSSASLTPASAASTAPPTAASPLTEGRSFAIGSHCVVAVPDRSIGPLYVSFNGLIRPVTVDERAVITIFGTTPTT